MLAFDFEESWTGERLTPVSDGAKSPISSMELSDLGFSSQHSFLEWLNFKAAWEPWQKRGGV